MERLAETSRRAYRSLLEAPDFLSFYRQATPIDALENSRIGSRPSRRTGKPSLADLRAIPWVFSWSQARFYVPGWFGMGSALESLSETEVDQLSEQVRAWPFWRYVLTNVESSLASADPDLMRAYAELVSEPELRARFLDQILGEWRRTHAMLERIRGRPLGDRRPRMLRTLELRSEALRILHTQQIALLARWRRLQAENATKEADALLPELLLSINAIASGLRTTG
jgi:phosphoenolpyruvate carboxylase